MFLIVDEDNLIAKKSIRNLLFCVKDFYYFLF